MIGSEQKIKIDKSTPIRPADLMDLAVKNAQVETLSLSPGLQNLAANRSHALAATRPEAPNLNVQRGVGAVGALAGLLGVATGSEGLAAAGTGALQGSLANIERAMTEYNADLDGFEEGFQRLQLLEAQNEAKMEAQMQKAELDAQADQRALELRQEELRYIESLRLQAKKDFETFQSQQEPTAIEQQKADADTMRAQAALNNSRAQVMGEERRSQRTSELSSEVQRRQKRARDLQERLKVAQMSGADDTSKLEAEIEVNRQGLEQTLVQGEIEKILPGVNAADPTIQDLSAAYTRYQLGDMPAGLFVYMLNKALEQGTLTESGYRSAIRRFRAE